MFSILDVDDNEVGAFPMAFDDMPTGKIGAKKLKKLEMKAEKRAMREVGTLVYHYTFVQLFNPQFLSQYSCEIS